MQDARVAKQRDVQHIGRREENGSGQGEEGKVASLLLYRKKWADRGEGGKALAFVMKIEDWVMMGLAEEGL